MTGDVNLKKWIRNKLITFLGIDEISMEIEKLRINDNTLNSKLTILSNENKELSNINKNLLKQFNLAVDVNPYENQSWAVISIQGKAEYVRFVSLHNRDMREIHNFIKQFEKTNYTIDTPYKFF